MRRTRSAGFLAIAIVTAGCWWSLSPAWTQTLNPAPSAWSNDTVSCSYAPVFRTLVVGSVLTAVASRYDRSMRRTMRQRDWLEFGGVDLGDIYGSGVPLGVFAIGAWGLGGANHNPKLRETGTILLRGLVLDAVLTEGIKFAVRRERPDHTDRESFPSGHTSIAFTGSTILARRYGWRAGVPLFALATATAVARMEDDRHFLSDVAGGATLGIAVGCLVTPGHHAHAMPVAIIAGPRQLAFGVNFR